MWLNLPTNPPIVNYNQLWFYYSGRAGGHGAQFPEAYGAIGLATLRIDGFCSMYGGEQAGAILTKPVTWPGGELMVNADPRRDISGHHSGDDGTYGSVPGGAARPGEQAARRLPLRRLQPDHPQHPNFKEEPVWTALERDNLAVKAVTWKEGRSARELAGRRIRCSSRSGTPTCTRSAQAVPDSRTRPQAAAVRLPLQRGCGSRCS